MYILHDPDLYESYTEYRPCSACEGDSRRCNGMCTGAIVAGTRVRAPAEVARIKAERARSREDAILAQADAIRARRAS